eukprot:TRINITY_DN42781_c0_g1_i1.p1 TRINITY_DN42781_c0_g1~~TRINITY_DN42781_c0_g1_i1.p1  ORF type:complete len:723 (+),score=100.63 TRINITY_DN42781_c0_g1_i1:105-2171(+)
MVAAPARADSAFEEVQSTTNMSLRPYRWRRFPTGAIRPKRWLERQAQLQAKALTSHLPLFWPEIANTSWLGGDADNIGGIHESTPYWLNGAVPLAYQLQDRELMQTVERYIDGILIRQTSEGWLGPDTDMTDFWSRYPVVLALVQYHEANPHGSSARERVLRAALAFFTHMAARLRHVELLLWSSARAHDLIWAIHYFVDVLQVENPTDGNVAPLLHLAEVLHERGLDWNGEWFNSSRFPLEAVETSSMWTHGVNNAQAIKHGAVWGRQAADAASGPAQSRRAWEVLSKYHGQPSGIFSADEYLAGTMPSRGTELCVVVESLWSLTLLAQASLDDRSASEALDAAEKIALNALPGSLSEDLWSHPYLQFANSYQARPTVDDHIWWQDGSDAGMYGLAPQYECCTANFHQGYPKLISSLFFEEPAQNSLVSALWMPSELNTSIDVGGGATVELRTDYPFGVSAEYVIRNPKAFFLRVRLPAFLRESAGPSEGLATLRVWVEGHERLVELVDDFLVYEIPSWSLPESRVAVRLEWAAGLRVVKARPGSGQGVSFFSGPLLLAPDLGEQRRVVHRYAFDAADYDITAGRPWLFAVPPASFGARGPVQRHTPGAIPFAHNSTACSLRASSLLLRLDSTAWQTAHNAPGPLPSSGLLAGNVENVTLLPYGCTAIRVSALPELKTDPSVAIVWM